MAGHSRTVRCIRCRPRRAGRCCGPGSGSPRRRPTARACPGSVEVVPQTHRHLVGVQVGIHVVVAVPGIQRHLVGQLVAKAQQQAIAGLGLALAGREALAGGGVACRVFQLVGCDAAAHVGNEVAAVVEVIDGRQTEAIGLDAGILRGAVGRIVAFLHLLVVGEVARHAQTVAQGIADRQARHEARFVVRVLDLPADVADAQLLVVVDLQVTQADVALDVGPFLGHGSGGKGQGRKGGHCQENGLGTLSHGLASFLEFEHADSAAGRGGVPEGHSAGLRCVPVCRAVQPGPALNVSGPCLRIGGHGGMSLFMNSMNDDPSQLARSRGAFGRFRLARL